MFPVLFRFGPLNVYSYGLMLGLGFLAATLVAARDARRFGIKPEAIIDFSFYSLIAGVVGSRLLFILFDWRTYLANPRLILVVYEGGLSLHGGLAAGVLVGIWFTRKYKIPFFTLADLVSPAVALAISVARIGCFLNGCCYGLPTDLPWAVATRYVAGLRHPTQLYEMLLSFLLFVFLWLRRTRTAYPGQQFVYLLIGYSVVRIIVESYREVWRLTPFLSVAQLGSLFIIGIALAISVYAKGRAGQ